MHDPRPPSRRRTRRRRGKRRTERERELDRERQRERRKRENDGTITFPGRCSPRFIEAMKARAMFFGAKKQEAERDADDPKKIAELALAVLDDFAAHWYERRK
jgi:hypothetical protein